MKVLVFLLSILLVGCGYRIQKEPLSTTTSRYGFADFQKLVCIKCHTYAKSYTETRSRLDEILFRTQTKDPLKIMPPSWSEFTLTAEEKAMIAEWVAAGGPEFATSTDSQNTKE